MFTNFQQDKRSNDSNLFHKFTVSPTKSDKNEKITNLESRAKIKNYIVLFILNLESRSLTLLIAIPYLFP